MVESGLAVREDSPDATDLNPTRSAYQTDPTKSDNHRTECRQPVISDDKQAVEVDDNAGRRGGESNAGARSNSTASAAMGIRVRQYLTKLSALNAVAG